MPNARLVNAKLLEFARQMRSEMVSSEWKLWQCLRNRQLNDWKFRRQHPMPPYIADFYCSNASLVVEIDGDSHSDRVQYDGRRTKRFERDGVSVIRFENGDVQENLEAVLGEIVQECERLTTAKSPSP